jgi:hypothetical protein
MKWIALRLRILHFCTHTHGIGHAQNGANQVSKLGRPLSYYQPESSFSTKILVDTGKRRNFGAFGGYAALFSGLTSASSSWQSV